MSCNTDDYSNKILDALLSLKSESGRTRTIQARGTSMLPLIEPGDALIIEHCAARQTRMGDVIVVRVGKTLLVHRLVKKINTENGPLLFEKGDNAWRIAGVEPPDFLGRVIEVKTARGALDLQRPGFKILGVVISLHGRLALRLARCWNIALRLVRPGSDVKTDDARASLLMMPVRLLARLMRG